jgi:transposase
LPESLDQSVEESNPVRIIDAFVEQLDLDELSFKLAQTAVLGRPGYNPALHVKLYIYGYLNRVQSSRRLERECQRNLEVMWLLGRLAPDHKTIADFRKDNGAAIKKVFSAKSRRKSSFPSTNSCGAELFRLRLLMTKDAHRYAAPTHHAARKTGRRLDVDTR